MTSRRVSRKVRTAIAQAVAKSTPGSGWGPAAAKMWPYPACHLPVGLSAAAIREAICQLSGELSWSYPGYPQDIRSYPPGYPLLSAASRDHKT
eukprot:2665045-Prymnesium_polylepis.1